jgi:hypothetical protein
MGLIDLIKFLMTDDGLVGADVISEIQKTKASILKRYKREKKYLCQQMRYERNLYDGNCYEKKRVTDYYVGLIRQIKRDEKIITEELGGNHESE